MQKRTKYSYSLVSKTLPIIRRASNNYLYFNQIENILCFAVYELSLPPNLKSTDTRSNRRFRLRNAYWYS